MDEMLEKGINFSIDMRERKATVAVNGSISLALNISQKTGEPVSNITGQILKNGRTVGGFNMDRNSGFANVSFDGFMSLTPEERTAIYGAFDTSVTELLAEG
ncbi:hypothetical protein [Parabacteroides sp. PF5-9]|uniref:hypothetical protein n=1 Tax=Parabacteroides sp. PF5-9 TaxID=1742404 RepID=UPI002475D260|nr:hypothetical protein [Parabacteroides sp. PF5-9]MDH6357247.1 hypothetical protein [Parabacteroides sp. PF5-9]